MVLLVGYGILLSCMLLSSWGHVADCPLLDGWLQVDPDFCLLVSTDLSMDTFNWKQASDWCASLHPLGYLASLEAHALEKNLIGRLIWNIPYWLGIQALFSKDGGLTWTDGTLEIYKSQFVISPFLTGSPSHVCGHVKIAVTQMDPVRLGLKWTLDNCKAKHPFICMLDRNTRSLEASSSDPQPLAQTANSKTQQAAYIVADAASNPQANKAGSLAPAVAAFQLKNLTHAKLSNKQDETPVLYVQNSSTDGLVRFPSSDKSRSENKLYTEVDNKNRFGSLRAATFLLAHQCESVRSWRTHDASSKLLKLKCRKIFQKLCISNKRINYEVCCSVSGYKACRETTLSKSMSGKGSHKLSEKRLKRHIKNDNSNSQENSSARGRRTNRYTHSTRRVTDRTTTYRRTTDRTTINLPIQHRTTFSSSLHSIGTTVSTRVSTTPEVSVATNYPSTSGVSTDAKKPGSFTAPTRTSLTITTKHASSSTQLSSAPSGGHRTRNLATKTPASTSPATTTATTAGDFQCTKLSMLECLIEVANSSQNSEEQSMAIAESIIEELNQLAVSRPNYTSSTIITDFFQAMDVLLSVGYKATRSPLSPKMIDSVLSQAEHFLDKMMASSLVTTVPHDIHLELVNIDLRFLQTEVGSLTGRRFTMRSGQVTIDGVQTDTRRSTQARATVTALVINVPSTEVWLSGKQGTVKAVVVSPVLSLAASVGNVKVNLSHTFVLTAAPPQNTTMRAVCGFQTHFYRNETEKIWATEGCQASPRGSVPMSRDGHDGQAPASRSTNRSSNGDNYLDVGLSFLRCKCNHTTNFAILMQIVDFPVEVTDGLALSIITYIGCSITIVTQVMAITVFTCIRSLNSERVCVHRNLCVSIMAAQVTFIAGIRAVEDRVVCAVVAVILHYFHTASFVWMLVEGLHLYNKIVKVFGTETSRIFYYTCFGYGLPMLLVVISAAVDWDGYGTKRSCWLSIQRSTIYAFVGPAVAIMFVNFVILIVVIRIVVTSAKLDSQSDHDHIRAGLKATLFLLPLLGLTWIFGLMAVNEDLVIFQYIFAVLNSLQISPRRFRLLASKNRVKEGISSLEYVCNMVAILTYAILGLLLGDGGAICLLTSLTLSSAICLLTLVLEGFLIFMCHCVFNSEVRYTLRRMQEKRSLQKGYFANSSSASDRPSSSDSRYPTSVSGNLRETMFSVFGRPNQVSPNSLGQVKKEMFTGHLMKPRGKKGQELPDVCI